MVGRGHDEVCAVHDAFPDWGGKEMSPPELFRVVPGDVRTMRGDCEGDAQGSFEAPGGYTVRDDPVGVSNVEPAYVVDSLGCHSGLGNEPAHRWKIGAVLAPASTGNAMDAYAAGSLLAVWKISETHGH